MDSQIWILVGAVLFDLIFGEPPGFIHLTVWAGKAISVAGKIGLEISSPVAQFIFGMSISLLFITFFGGFTWWLLGVLKSTDTVLVFVMGVFILKSAFCLRFNGQISLLVKEYLDGGDFRPEKANKEVRFLLTTVERDEGDRIVEPIVSSTIRSLTENASDFLVAPLFYFLVLGVPGAIAYRVSNTLDGMIGHRGKYEYLGKFSAYFDDVLNFIPARITALMFVIAALFSGLNSRKAWRIMLRDHGKTESPNAGWPMAAAAGALEVQLDRAGHYALGDADHPLTADTIGRAVKLFRFMAAIDISGSIAVLALLHYLM